ncbi:MAG: Hint domain-containing protein [Pseudomonadota bacterium]
MSYRDSVNLFSLMQPVHRRAGEGDPAPGNGARNVVALHPAETAPCRPGQIACFGPGTRLATPKGNVPLAQLKAGDLVQTLDAGAQPVAWINHIDVMGYGHDTPVTVGTGVLGNSAPLVVSQAQRLMISDGATELLFGAGAVLVAARDLIGLPGVTVTPAARVTYSQVLLADHQLLIANGTPAESLFLDPLCLASFDTVVRNALAPMGACFGSSVAPSLSAAEAAVWCHYASAA